MVKKKIQIGSKAPKFISLKINCPVTQKRRLKLKKSSRVRPHPPKMTQIIIKIIKIAFFFHSIKKNSTGSGVASHEYIFFHFFLVLLETIQTTLVKKSFGYQLFHRWAIIEVNYPLL